MPACSVIEAGCNPEDFEEEESDDEMMERFVVQSYEADYHQLYNINAATRGRPRWSWNPDHRNIIDPK